MKGPRNRGERQKRRSEGGGKRMKDGEGKEGGARPYTGVLAANC